MIKLSTPNSPKFINLQLYFFCEQSSGPPSPAEVSGQAVNSCKFLLDGGRAQI